MTELDAIARIPPHRARRMIVALLAVGPDAVGAEGNLPADTVERAPGDELGRRPAPWVAEFAKVRTVWRESGCLRVMDRVEAVGLAAIDRALKILDRIHRYRGVRHAVRPTEPYGEPHRERLLAKLDAIAANLAADEPSRDA